MSKWISVKRELPEKGKNVLIACKCAGNPASRFYDIGFYYPGNERIKYGWINSRRSATRNVTHWMPFPKDPAESEVTG